MNGAGIALMSGLGLLAGLVVARAAELPGGTRIAAWKYDRPAAFLLMFDDGEPTHLAHAIPGLEQLDLMGTFFLNPGAKWYDAAGWGAVAERGRMVLANHSMHHCGATNVAQAEAELGDCQEVLMRLQPGLKVPRLIALSYPGGSPWTLSKEDKEAMLRKYNLLVRPAADGHVAAMQLKTVEQMVARIDAALSSGGLDYLVFHGVGGDWHAVTLEDYHQVLDAVVARREKLWITDPVSAHKYARERDQARVRVLGSEPGLLRLALEATGDPLYDEPLTLVTPVPADWTTCLVTQGNRATTVAVEQGAVKYEALPDAAEIVLQSASQQK